MSTAAYFLVLSRQTKSRSILTWAPSQRCETCQDRKKWHETPNRGRYGNIYKKCRPNNFTSLDVHLTRKYCRPKVWFHTHNRYIGQRRKMHLYPRLTHLDSQINLKILRKELYDQQLAFHHPNNVGLGVRIGGK